MVNRAYSTVGQNEAHRADLVWIKVGRSEYMRGDGVTIRRDNNSGRWVVYLASGEIAQCCYSGKFYNSPLSEHSLTWAKIAAKTVDSETPAYVRAAR